MGVQTRAMRQGVIRRFWEWLPQIPEGAVTTIGEGDTPLIEAPTLSGRVGARLFLKFEGMNPTASFKDRGMTVATSRAVAAGSRACICASTGNTAASAAAYASRHVGVYCISRLARSGCIDCGDCMEELGLFDGFGQIRGKPCL